MNRIPEAFNFYDLNFKGLPVVKTFASVLHLL